MAYLDPQWNYTGLDYGADSSPADAPGLGSSIGDVGRLGLGTAGLALGAPIDRMRAGVASMFGGTLDDPSEFSDPWSAMLQPALDRYGAAVPAARRGVLSMVGATPNPAAQAIAQAQAAVPAAAALQQSPLGNAAGSSPLGAEGRGLGDTSRTPNRTAPIGNDFPKMMLDLHNAASNSGQGAYDSAYKEELARHMKDVQGIDLDKEAQSAAAKLGMPGENISSWSNANKAMLLFQLGTHMMGAASRPGAGLFGSLAEGSEAALGSLGEMQKLRREEMGSARQEALQKYSLQRTAEGDARQGALDRTNAGQQQFANQLDVGRLGVSAYSAQETHADRMAAIQEKKAAAAARVAARNNIVGTAQKMAHDQFVAQSNPMTNPASVEPGFQPKSENDFLEEILARTPQWQALQTADMMAGTYSGGAGVGGGGPLSHAAAAPPQVGQEVNGYIYVGGDFKSASSWKKK